jgi:hypothetical protein
MEHQYDSSSTLIPNPDAPLDNIIRLFISSTFSDFQVERTVLQRRVFPRLRALCREGGVRFQPIDMRWGVSEEASLAQQTVQICLEEIRRCQRVSPDLNFVLFLGDRYGSRRLPETIPADDYAALVSAMDVRERALFEEWYRLDRNASEPTFVLLPRPAKDNRWRERVEEPLLRALDAAAQTTLDEQTALPYTASVTHLEIVHGLLRLPETRSVICAFRRFSPTPEPGAAGVYGESDTESRQRLNILTATVKQRLGEQAREYRIPWRRRWFGRVSDPVFDNDALERELYEMFEGPVLAAIAQRQDARTAQNPLTVANARFADERAAHFTGRAEQLRTLSAYLADGALDVPRPPFVVTGPAGSGKSTLLAQAVKEATATHPDVALMVRYIGITPETTDLRQLLAGVRNEIFDTYGVGEEGRSSLPTDDTGLIATFPAILRYATAERPLLLVIDALDQLGTEPVSLDWLPSVLPAHVRILVSILPERGELAQLVARLPQGQIVRLDSMDLREGKELLDRWLTDAGRDLQTEQRRAVMEAFAPDGNPLHLRLLFEEARQWRSFTPTSPQPATIPSVLTRLFDTLALRHGPLLVGRALGFIGAGREGVAEEEALDLLSAEDAVRSEQRQRAPNSPPIDPALPLPDTLWARFYVEVAPYLAVRQGSGAQVITFYHQALRAAAVARYLAPHDERERHLALANYFAAQPLLAGTQPNRRKLAELAYQQAQAGQVDALRETVTDARFLEQRIAVSGTQTSLDDLAYLPRDEASRSLDAALRLSAHVLDRDPAQLVSQVTGRMGSGTALHATEPHGPHLRLTTKSLTASGGPLQRILMGHSAGVASCAWSPDGRTLATASHDGTVRLWEASSGRELRTLTGHTSMVSACAWSPDGRTLAATSSDGSIHLWEATSGRELCTFSSPTYSMNAHAWSPDGRTLAIGSDDQAVRLWDVATGQERARCDVDAPVNCCDWHSQKPLVAAGDASGAWHLMSCQSDAYA